MYFALYYDVWVSPHDSRVNNVSLSYFTKDFTLKDPNPNILAMQ